MAKAINLSQKSLDIINGMLDEDSLECKIELFNEMEDFLQESAYGEEGEQSRKLYEYAYEMKLLRQKFVILYDEISHGKK